GRGGGCGALGDRRCGRRSRGLGLAVGANGAALLDLDDHLLAAAMTEALAHHARLSAPLERQSGLHAQRLAIRGLGVGHSVLESLSVRFAAKTAFRFAAKTAFRFAAKTAWGRRAGSKALKARISRQKRVICRPGKQGCMYHI